MHIDETKKARELRSLTHFLMMRNIVKHIIIYTYRETMPLMMMMMSDMLKVERWNEKKSIYGSTRTSVKKKSKERKENISRIS